MRDADSDHSPASADRDADSDHSPASADRDADPDHSPASADRDADPDHSPASAEAGRKVVHMAAAIAAAGVAWLLPANYAQGTFAAAALVALAVDLARLKSPAVARTFRRTVGSMLRTTETRRLTGATTLAVGFALAALIAPPHLAAICFLYAGFADTAAAAVGRRFGRHRTRWGKSVEGSTACFATALAIGLVAPGVTPAAALLAAVATALAEAAPGPDNVAIPVAGAVILRLAAGT